MKIEHSLPKGINMGEIKEKKNDYQRKIGLDILLTKKPIRRDQKGIKSLKELERILIENDFTITYMNERRILRVQRIIQGIREERTDYPTFYTIKMGNTPRHIRLRVKSPINNKDPEKLVDILSEYVKHLYR
ncbi:hypothetical protein JW949_03575 [Candidatus Woesearchaeota archaeon]|nr:hypothetical protein [Candidatus Woesearchaeota archaeon]